jgi:hypothetical protein
MDLDYQILNTKEDIIAFFTWAKNHPSSIICLDLETNSAEEIKAEIFGIGISFDEEQSFYIPIKTPKNTAQFLIAFEKYIINELYALCSLKELLGHNIIYDVVVLKHRTNLDFYKFVKWDTILMKHLLDEERPFGLKELAVRELGPTANQSQKDLEENVKAKGGKWLKEQKDMWMGDTNILGKYCCFDTHLTIKLFNKYKNKLEAQNLLKFYHEETLPLYTLFTIPMKIGGVPIDLEYLQKLNIEVAQEITKLESEIYKEIQPYITNFEYMFLDKEYPLKPNVDIISALLNTYNISMPTNKQGNPSIAKKGIESLYCDNEEVNKICDWVLHKGPAPLSPYYHVRKRIYLTKNNMENLFNLNSNMHLAYLFFTELNLEPLGKTEGGAPQVNDELLDSIKSKYKFVELLSNMRKLKKLQSTYIEGFLERQHNNILYPSFLQFGTTSGRYSSVNPNCLSLDTEILTPTGFVTYDKLKQNDLVAAFTGNSIVWQKINTLYISEQKEHRMVTIKNQHFDMKLTDNHRIIYQDRKTKKFHETTAEFFPKDCLILHGYDSNIGTYNIDSTFLQFLVAVQADGHIHKQYDVIDFGFHKCRKYERLLQILNKLQITFEDRSDKNRYRIIIKNYQHVILPYLTRNKIFPANFINLTAKLRKLFLAELMYWDGSFTRKQNYSSSDEMNVDLIQALFAIDGQRAHKRVYWNEKLTKPNFQLDVCNKNHSNSANHTKSIFHENTQVWCVNVDSGMILCRRGSDTFITGNCQNLPRIKDEDDSNINPLVLNYANKIRTSIRAPENYVLVNADYSSLEPICFSVASGETLIQDVFIKGYDLYSQIGINTFNITDASADKKSPSYLKNKYPEKRQIAKSITLSIPYGSESHRVSQMLSCSIKEAQDVIDKYLGAFPQLSQWMEDQKNLALTQGYVTSMFGRIRHLPEAKTLYEFYGERLLDYRWAKSQGLSEERYKLKNLINNSRNFPIQSLAASIVNRAAIEIMKEINKLNLDVRPILQVHDELTFLAHKDIAEQFLIIMQNKMENTTKLPVPLTASPIIGTVWSEVK